MVDLIPIGSANRAANENNATRPAGNVQETARSNLIGDQDNPERIERRRSRNRRRSSGDRRHLTKSSRKQTQDRRKALDRRSVRRAQKKEAEAKPQPLLRKGRIIDERV